MCLIKMFPPQSLVKSFIKSRKDLRLSSSDMQTGLVLQITFVESIENKV